MFSNTTAPNKEFIRLTGIRPFLPTRRVIPMHILMHMRSGTDFVKNIYCGTLRYWGLATMYVGTVPTHRGNQRNGRTPSQFFA